ncbi:LuxR family two component transcriptional regulator [Krasilnikovia cinnamomea]|uniref:LuxR family two component transcriptional regulator n=1 Tax=Krasilnikovia cinnamomea TaxID=349313 RepID=A0A4Q7ZS34_9ACTN|nr:response regulator transcription factor [Krasilnikovia cinnamomea]RZU53978.1 LuxR family two component transcriptional regulator [Krasilnikovia cinnamomea]
MHELDRNGQGLFVSPRPGRTRNVGSIDILVAGDHALLREGLVELVAAEPDFRVVGQAGNSVTAVQSVAARRPRVILLDVKMPDRPVCATVRQIQRISPRTRVIVLAMDDDLRLLQDVLAAGAHAVLVRSASRQELVGVIRAVCHEANSVLVVSHRNAAQLAVPVSNPLSRRELQVLELAAQALSNAQIATRLCIVEGTVKRHLTNVYTKLGAVSRLDAVNKAKAARLLQPSSRTGAFLG